MSCFVGFDTSNYTTSVGIVDEDGRILANIKRLLPVKPGECGLRQSDAVFAHIKNLPDVLSGADAVLNGKTVAAVGYSQKPRNAEGSYMPCFLCGTDAALAFCAGRGITPFAFSHQCGHLSAALTSAGVWQIADAPFLAFHVSGGTTEVLYVRRDAQGFDTDIIGGTRDISAGQAIDRAGVRMGMQFPCGAALEAAADFSGKPQRPRICTDGAYCNLSGLQNLTDKYLHDGKSTGEVSAFVLDFLARTLLAMAQGAREHFGNLPILFAGGVMCNGYIKHCLQTLGDVYFAEPALSADNAVGIAELSRRAYLQI